MNPRPLSECIPHALRAEGIGHGKSDEATETATHASCNEVDQCKIPPGPSCVQDRDEPTSHGSVGIMFTLVTHPRRIARGRNTQAALARSTSRE